LFSSFDLPKIFPIFTVQILSKSNLLSMKRIFTLLLATLIISTTTYSQLRVGIVGGGHQSDILETNSLPNWNTIKQNYKPRTGIHFGLNADLPISKSGSFTFQPNVLFYHKGRKYNEIMDTTFSDTLNLKRSEFLNYLDVPLNLVVKFKLGRTVRFIVGGGPYFSFFFDGYLKSEVITKSGAFFVDENLDPEVGKGPGKYTTYDYGLNGLAGFEIGRVTLTANYSRGFNDIYESADYTGKFRNETKGIRLGVYLGKSVARGSNDRDKDGVPNKKDKCPDAAGSKAFGGCPDSDGDGLIDKEDGCPNVSGPGENKGCPYPDKDGDGLLDKDDKCPDVRGPKDNNGCPYADSDKDGVVDKDDKCPTVAGFGRYEGCPVPDTDADGINDEEDKCPSVKGLKANNGCPEIKQEIVEKVNYAAKRIQFAFTKADVAPASYKTLNEVADILKANPDLKLTIEGHTSNDGVYEMNKKLSLARANNVKAYLVDKGIAASRLTAIGYGPDRLLSNGKTGAEKAKNRRVELKLSNQ
jgi:OOP family OmpA-OmpF porin